MKNVVQRLISHTDILCIALLACSSPQEDRTDIGSQGQADAGFDGETDFASPPPDFDRDGVPDNQDQCLAGDDRDDIDLDGIPTACDPCPVTPPKPGRPADEDTDHDGVGDRCDFAPNFYNPSQTDIDLDRVPDEIDNCHGIPNQDQIDHDGDGFGARCERYDNDPTRNPEMPDLPCDGRDSNGDGIGELFVVRPNGQAILIGEPQCQCLLGTARQTGSSEGECEQGYEACLPSGDGGRFELISEAIGPTTDILDGKDNDCDGATDEGAACTPGVTQPCGIEMGICTKGTQTCNMNGQWNDACEERIAPEQTDLCDGLDNDCNGLPDDAYPVGAPCTALGDCGVGSFECATQISVRCSTETGGSEDHSGPEICDGRDNNCNGQIDEGGICTTQTPDAGAPAPEDVPPALPPPPPPPPPPPF